MFDAVWQDLRYAARSLIRRPLFTAAAVLSLALGVGVNTAIFSVFERVLLRPLPVPAPEQLVTIASPGPRPGWTSSNKGGGADHIFSYALFRDLERLDVPGVSRIAAHRDFAANLAYEGRTVRGDGLLVSGGYFPALGLVPSLGRLILPDDDRIPGGHPIVVLAHDYWKTDFGSDPGVLGRTLIVNGSPMTIAGVGPAGFRGTVSMDSPDVFVPLAMAEQMRARDLEQRGGIAARNDHWLYLFARLEPGTTREQAQTTLNGPFQAIIRDEEFPILRSGMGDRAREEFLERGIVLDDGRRERNADLAETRLLLVLLFAITGLVLLIACTNVANLLLARAADRRAEIAVRLSIGASSGRVTRLLLLEASVLGALGAAGALAVAVAASRGILRILPPEDAALLPFELNVPVLLFTTGLGLAAALVVGLLPALHSLQGGLATGLRQQAFPLSSSRRAVRLRAVFGTAQVALATVLLVQAGLFLVSLVNLARTELGMQPNGLVTFRVSPYLNGYTPAQADALFERLENELRALPGVSAVTASTTPLLADNNTTRNVTAEGYTPAPDADTSVSFAQTGADYLRTLGIPLVAGRDFTSTDTATAPRVAIVNEAFARKFELGDEVIGKHLALGAGDDKPLDIEIVGLVRDAKYSQVRRPAPAQLLVPYRQGEVGPLTFYVRSSGDARQLLSAIPAVVARADANLPVERLRTMEEQIWDNVTAERVLATLSSSFAGLATVLAAFGLYAVLAYGVAQRFREIGIRVAVGARPADVRRLVFAHVARMTIVGAAIGVAAALGLGRAGQALLFGVEGSDPVVVGSAVALVTTVALMAAALPAHRASRVDPVATLRAE